MNKYGVKRISFNINEELLNEIDWFCSCTGKSRREVFEKGANRFMGSIAIKGEINCDCGSKAIRIEDYNENHPFRCQSCGAIWDADNNGQIRKRV